MLKMCDTTISMEKAYNISRKEHEKTKMYSPNNSKTTEYNTDDKCLDA